MHPDDDELALAALGEAGRATRDHVAGCEACAAQLRDLERVVGAGRLGPLVEPPARVWDAIAAAVAEPEVGHEVEPAAPVTALRPRRWARVLRVAAVAVVAAGLGAGAVLGAQWWSAPRETVLASAALEPLPGWRATGTASVEERDGARELVVRLPEEAVDGFRQVWVASDDLTRMVPVGVLTGARGTFALPSDLDLSDYVVVDISAEPDDGDPAHSGVSLARGDLDG